MAIVGRVVLVELVAFEDADDEDAAEDEVAALELEVVVVA